MTLRVLGAGPPRTGTESLSVALGMLLGEPCYHMRHIPGHPYALGRHWSLALAGGTPKWKKLFQGYAGAVDWPASLFWRELADAYPHAVVLLSRRDTTDTWLDSMAATVVPVARAVAPQDWTGGRDLALLMERFTGTTDWDHREVLRRAYDDWLESVRREVPPDRLVEWQPGDGWGPLCAALGVPAPDAEFPWVNRRQDWAY